jgi:hypothetical protein
VGTIIVVVVVGTIIVVGLLIPPIYIVISTVRFFDRIIIMIQIDIVVIIPIGVGVVIIIVLGGIRRRNRRGSSIRSNTGSIGRRSIGFITTGNGGGGGVGDHPTATPRYRIICRWDGSSCCYIDRRTVIRFRGVCG